VKRKVILEKKLCKEIIIRIDLISKTILKI